MCNHILTGVLSFIGGMLFLVWAGGITTVGEDKDTGVLVARYKNRNYVLKQLVLPQGEETTKDRFGNDSPRRLRPSRRRGRHAKRHRDSDDRTAGTQNASRAVCGPVRLGSGATNRAGPFIFSLPLSSLERPCPASPECIPLLSSPPLRLAF